MQDRNDRDTTRLEPATDPTTHPTTRWDRRGFLKGLGAVFSTAVLSEGLVGCAIDALAPAGSVGQAAAPLDATFTWGVTATRPTDLVAISFEFANMTLDAAKQNVVATGMGQAAIALVLPPQHLLEPAIGVGTGPAMDPIPVLAAAPTRLVFLVPTSGAPIAYSIRGLLGACAKLPISVEPNATEGTGPAIPAAREPRVELSVTPLRDARRAYRAARLRERLRRVEPSAAAGIVGGGVGGGTGGGGITINPNALKGIPRAPTSSETGVEILTRLVVSPHEAARWQHEVDPFVSPSSGRTELWRTRLATAYDDGRVLEATRSNATVRAIWTRDTTVFDPTFAPYAVPSPSFNPAATTADAGSYLQPIHRAAIVHQSSNWSGSTPFGPIPQPTPIDVHALTLSPLGGTFHASAPAAWLVRPFAVWRHIASLGRDQYIASSTPGYLLPHGHRCTNLVIAERYVDDAAGTVGYLSQYNLLIVNEPVLAFDPVASRAHPFTAVEIVQRESPVLNAQVSPYGSNDTPWFPTVASTGEPLLLSAFGLDQDGNRAAFDLPVAFVQTLDAASIGNYMSQAASLGLLTLDLRGQRVAFVQSSGHATATETHSIQISVAAPTGATPPGVAPVAPTTTQATVTIEAARHLVNAATQSVVQYASQYALYGFNAAQNPTEAFLQLTQQIPLTFSAMAKSSGSLVTPDTTIGGLSRAVGLVGGDLGTFASQGFNPASFFSGSLPKLLGLLDLTQLVGGLSPQSIVQSAENAVMSAMPKCVTESLDTAERIIADATRLYQRVQGGALQLAVSNAAAAGAAQVQQILATINGRMQALASDLQAVWTYLGKPDLDGLTGITGFLQNPQSPAPGSPLANLIADLNVLVPGFASIEKAAPNLPIAAIGLYKEIEQVAARLQALLGQASAIADAINKLQQGLDAVKDLQVRFEWRPALPNSNGTPLLGVFMPNDPNGLLLSIEARAKATRDPATGQMQQPGADVLCSLENFELWVLGSNPVIKLAFDRVFFQEKVGKKPEVDVVFRGLTFGNQLTLLNKLKDIVPLDGLSDPPYLDVSSNQIAAGFTLAVPSVSMGAFALRNIKLAAGVTLPFLGGGLGWSFNFCTKQDPFNLTVSLLGGGGYLMLGGDAGGMKTLEASIEFGAYAALDLGVAEGEVSIAAGAYLHLESNDATFGAFLRIRGAVVVLGIIGVSVELLATVQYDATAHQLDVSGDLSVEVDIGPFSKSVDLSYRATFDVGSSSQSALRSLPDPASRAHAYESYLAAFAA